MSTLLYQLVERYYPEFTANLAEQGKYLPKYVEREFDEFLRCGRLEYGFLRVVCGDCKHEKLVAFSCKRRGFCPGCGVRRMAESAALLVDDVLRGYPIAMGPQQGQKVFTLQTLPASNAGEYGIRP